MSACPVVSEDSGPGNTWLPVAVTGFGLCVVINDSRQVMER